MPFARAPRKRSPYISAPVDYTKRTGYQIYKKALEKGVLLRPLGDVIYFNPPLIIVESDMVFVTDIALECTKEILSNYSYGVV